VDDTEERASKEKCRTTLAALAKSLVKKTSKIQGPQMIQEGDEKKQVFVFVKTRGRRVWQRSETSGKILGLLGQDTMMHL